MKFQMSIRAKDSYGCGLLSMNRSRAFLCSSNARRQECQNDSQKSQMTNEMFYLVATWRLCALGERILFMRAKPANSTFGNFLGNKANVFNKVFSTR